MTSIYRRAAAGVLALPMAGFLAQRVHAHSVAPPPGHGVIDDARGYETLHHPVRGFDGMVVSQSRPASEVGAAILRKGGNAVDAAVAVGLAEAVTLPRAGNLGGGGFMLIHLAKERRTVAIDYYFKAPAALTADAWRDANGKLDRGHALSYKGVAIPGTVAGLYRAHRQFGRLPWRAVVQPALDLAIAGVVLSEDEAMILKWGKSVLDKDAAARQIFSRRDGGAYEAGERLRQPDLAWSLRQVRDHGPAAFYTGEIAAKLVAASRAGGGYLTREDLAAYQPLESEPLWSTYRGHRLALAPPAAAGATLAEILNILETFPLAQYGQGSVLGTHLMAEAIRLAAADRARFVGGAPYRTPAQGLVSKAFAQQRAALINPEQCIAPADLAGADPFAFDSKDTTHFSVADADGNLVTNTYTLVANFGAGVVAPGTGILLNNALSNFNWEDAASPSAPAGGKRIGSPITPFILFKGDEPWIASGTPGGSYIFSALAQFIVNVVDHGLNIAEATARPRIDATPDNVLTYESGFSPDVVRLLEARGHRMVPGITQTSIQSVELRDGRIYGAADPRRPDSAAVGSERRHE